jgi:hypothetical protein
MAEFNIQSDSVDVTRIMEEIRERIREKRGADYTEEQIRELATVKLERFLDPGQVRSELVEHYRQLEPPRGLDPIPWAIPGPPPEPFEFTTETIYASSRGVTGTLIQMIRKLLNPLLKLLFNPDPLVFALSRQAEINAYTLQLLQQQTDLAERINKQFERAGAKFQAREQVDALNYEVLNNLVVEMTRLSVDMKNHMMRVESVAGRLDFSERRARALESVVQTRSAPPAEDQGSGDAGEGAATGAGRPRRRRRRSRRRGGSGDGTPTGEEATVPESTTDASGTAPEQNASNAPAPSVTSEQASVAAATPAAPHEASETPAAADPPPPTSPAPAAPEPTVAPLDRPAARPRTETTEPPPAAEPPRDETRTEPSPPREPGEAGGSDEP